MGSNMQTARYSRLAICLFAASFMGAGCLQQTPAPSQPAGAFSNMSPAEITKRLVFKEGSSFVLTRTAVRRGDTYELAEQPDQSLRTVTIKHFNGETASFDWKLEERIETDESRQARAADAEAAPESVYETQTTEGSLSDLDFTESHALYLPLRWPEERTGDRESAVWVSKPVFEELTRTRNSTVYLNVIPALLDAARAAPGLSSAIERFRQQEGAVIGRIDTDFMKAEGDRIEWPVTVNGEQVKVEALRARNWFGEIVILNNGANPLVLKLTVNPPIEGAEDASADMSLLKAMVNFEIPSIQL